MFIKNKWYNALQEKSVIWMSAMKVKVKCYEVHFLHILIKHFFVCLSLSSVLIKYELKGTNIFYEIMVEMH